MVNWARPKRYSTAFAIRPYSIKHRPTLRSFHFEIRAQIKLLDTRIDSPLRLSDNSGDSVLEFHR
jgi:hypothetical protein